MIRILVLSCGANAAYHFITILRDKFPFDFFIIGADINESHLVSTANLLDSFHQVPRNDVPHYYETIINLCKNERVNVILPIFDADQQLFYPQNLDLKNYNIFSLGMPKQTLEIYQNKGAMFRFLQQNRFAIPRIYKNIKPNQTKYFVKPQNGFGSLGAKILSGAEICALTSRQNLIVQELCKEPEITLECFYYQGKIASIARERIAVKSGVCIKARIFYDSHLEQIALDFAKSLQTPLYFNLQFMHDSKGALVITDINLRFAAGMSLSYTAKWDAVSAIAKVLLGQKQGDIFATLQKPKAESFAIRAYSDIITRSANSVVAFDLDGTLLDSKARHKIVLDEILRELGIKLDTSDLIESKRSGKNNVDFLLARGISLQIAQKIQCIWIERIERDKYLAFDRLYPHTLQMLRHYAKNHLLILITARRRKNATLNQIKGLDLDKFFKKIFVVAQDSNVAQQKARILKQYGANLMIGDSEIDFEASNIANIAFRFAESGFRSVAFMNDYIVKNAQIRRGGGESHLAYLHFTTPQKRVA